MTEYGLGRLPEFDERSRGFRAVSPFTELLAPVTKTWRRGTAYDQGQTPQCVAFTGKGILNTAPWSGMVPYRTRIRYSTQEFYDGAQRNDQWPGENYDGTSALGLGKYLLSKGLISEYRWNFGLADTLLALSYTGPVGIGVDWWTKMFSPVDGFVEIGGQVEGGHEVELIGVNVEHEYVIGMNSWGPYWGLNGRFRMRYDTLNQLLMSGGDSVVLKR